MSKNKHNNHFQQSYSSISDHFEQRYAELYQSKSHPTNLRREPSLAEQKQTYHPPGYHFFFCIHDKHNFSACSACGRTQQDADFARDVFLGFFK